MGEKLYANEVQLVADLSESLKSRKSPLMIEQLAHEFDYRNGRVDLIAISNEGDLIAFEAKLVNWKVALHQAYKNSSFAHFSYVVLPSKSIRTALKWCDKFIKYGIGLCSVNNTSINVIIHGRRNDPFLPWLTESAYSFINEE